MTTKVAMQSHFIEAELGCKQNNLTVISMSRDSGMVVKDGNDVEVRKKGHKQDTGGCAIKFYL